MSEPTYTVRYIINGHERRVAGAYPVRYNGSASESFILSEFQRMGRIPRVDGGSIKSIVVESIERH